MKANPNPDSQQLLRELVADASEHGLVLFVGAGINTGFLSQWNGLLDDLLKEAIREATVEDPRMDGLEPYLLEWCKAHFDVCAQASLVKHILGPERFRLELQDALYRQKTDVEQQVREYCSGDGQENSELEFLRCVAELCGNPQVKAVATFNFDTLLEHAILGCGKRNPRSYFGQVATVQEEKRDSSLEDIPVFHVHGLLSPPGSLLRCSQEPVVFAYDEYFEKNSDPLSWETSSSLHLLRHFCTLWLGASLKDWNMLRLLNAAKGGHGEAHSYCLQCLQETGTTGLSHNATQGEAKRFRQMAMRLQATMFDAVGMRLIITGNGFNTIIPTIAEWIMKPFQEKTDSIRTRHRSEDDGR